MQVQPRTPRRAHRQDILPAQAETGHRRSRHRARARSDKSTRSVERKNTICRHSCRTKAQNTTRTKITIHQGYNSIGVHTACARHTPAGQGGKSPFPSPFVCICSALFLVHVEKLTPGHNTRSYTNPKANTRKKSVYDKTEQHASH